MSLEIRFLHSFFGFFTDTIEAISEELIDRLLQGKPKM
jgi:hypothetical protein